MADWVSRVSILWLVSACLSVSLSCGRSQSSNADACSLDYLLFDSDKTDLNASADH
jgi:hypothetical protein